MPSSTVNMGITKWSASDFFSHTVLATNWDVVDAHDHTTGKGKLIPTAGITDAAVTTPKLADGSVTTAKLAAAAATADKLADAAKLGLTDSGAIRRGKSIIPAAEPRTNVAYGLLPTPDRVQNVVLPTDGFLVILYEALWQNSIANQGMASLFVGTNQVLAYFSDANSGPDVLLPLGPGNAGVDRPLLTTGVGLTTLNPASASNATAPGAFAVAVGTVPTGTNSPGSSGAVYVSAPAGTYDVSVQFKAASGSVTVKNRKLWVWTIAF